MSSFTFKVASEHDGMNVGIYLKYIHGVSSRNIKSLKKHPLGITLNGEHIRTIDKIKTDDVVGINIIDNVKEIPANDISVEILYEDKDVIVFNKPYNMTCHPSRKHHTDTLGNVFVSVMQKQNTSASFRCINRLDKDTTGAVAVAKNQHSAYCLQKEMKKQYIGIIKGELPFQKGTIEGNILRIDEIHIKRMVHPDGQYSKTDYELLKKNGDYSLYSFTLHTGRTHQIRVHTSSIGFPLIGDMLYGGDLEVMNRQALHCASLAFTSPTNKELIIVNAPLPKDMAEIIGRYE